MKDDEEEEKDEAKEEYRQEEEDEESDPMRIATHIIAFVSHSPPKYIVSSMETTSTSVIVTTIDTSYAQSLFSPS